MHHRLSNHGFTLYELVIVMLIVGILSAIGIPSFKYVTASNRISSEINGLLGDLQFARTEAVKEGIYVSVCPSSTGAACLTGSQGNWLSGWIVFVDVNGNGVWEAGDVIIRKQGAATATDTLIADNTVTKAVTFNRLGYGTAQYTQTTTVKLHSTPINANWTRCLAITTVGMMTTQKSGVGNCS